MLIEWISDWLKQIIILVLIATFIDLLLPNNALDRYVKLVMGLLIIMAIMTPIFHLLSQKMDLSALAFTNVPAGQGQMASLQQIEEQSAKVKTTQDRLIQEQSAKQMEKSIKEQVRQKFGVDVIEAKVELHVEPQGRTEIKQIDVLVRQPTPARSVPGEAAIQPVHIDIGGGKTGSPAAPSEQAGQTGQVSTVNIATYLSDAWQLRREQVRVVMDAL